MSQNSSEKSSTLLYDVAACFPEDEWKMLHEWQKELYKNIMKEIHHALTSLGTLIVTTVVSLRAKENEDLCPMNSEDSRRRHSINCSPSGARVSPDLLFRIHREEHAHLINAVDSDGRERNDCLDTGDTVNNPDALIGMNREEELHLIHEEDPEGKERNGYIGADFSHNTGMYLRKEEPVSIFIDHCGEEVKESSTDHNPVASLHIKDEEEAYSLDHQDVRRIKIISAPSDNEGMIKEWKDHGTGKNIKRKTPYRARSGKIKIRVVEDPEEETNNRSQRWPISEETPRESSSNNPVHSILHPENDHVDLSDNYVEHKSNIRNVNLLVYQHETTQKKTRYSCAICRKSFSAKPSVARHQRTHTGERPFQCTICGKSFIQSGDLIRHRRSHSGERPYHCTYCGKRFSQKWHLGTHQRMHGILLS